MLGQTTRSSSGADNRVFIYEVTGLRQNEQTDQASHAVRNSSSIFMQVPYRRMNETMQRITRLGGKIQSIQTLSEFTAAKDSAEASS